MGISAMNAPAASPKGISNHSQSHKLGSAIVMSGNSCIVPLIISGPVCGVLQFGANLHEESAQPVVSGVVHHVPERRLFAVTLHTPVTVAPGVDLSEVHIAG